MRAVWVAVALIAAAKAGAEPLPVKTAEKLLFSARGMQVAINEAAGLSAVEVKTLQIMFKDNAFPYYGAVAYSPADGLVAEPTTMAQNLHSPEAANAAALKACEAKRNGGEPCRIAANVVPKGWKAQPLMLNQAASADIRTYKRGRGPKAMAISRATGVYSIAKGPNADRAALNDCLAKAQPMGATDCEVVIEDK